jgi:hypothetical protein
VLGVEPRALHMSGRRSTTELHSQTSIFRWHSFKGICFLLTLTYWLNLFYFMYHPEILMVCTVLRYWRRPNRITISDYLRHQLSYNIPRESYFEIYGHCHPLKLVKSMLGWHCHCFSYKSWIRAKCQCVGYPNFLNSQMLSKERGHDPHLVITYFEL